MFRKLAMDVKNLSIDGPLLITLQHFCDDRGYFLETFNTKAFEKHTGLRENFVQDNESVSHANVLRGLHFQKKPNAQGKLVRVLEGAIFDVMLDIDPNSNTFGEHISVTLSAATKELLWIPDTFAHGFLALEQNTRIAYKTTQYYAPESDAGVAWDDVNLGIRWPVEKSRVIISEKDQSLPPLSEASLDAGN